MAELKCKDGTVIKISDETEVELRKVFEPKPNYKNSALRVYINDDKDKSNVQLWPITIRIAKDCTNGKDYITRDVKDVEKFIAALQKTVTYCKQYDLGL